MEIPREYIDNFSKVINALSDDAKKKLSCALENIHADDLETLRTEILRVMDLILTPYTDNAAAVAATFYDGLREYQGIADDFYALSNSMRQYGTTAGAVYTYTEKHPQLDDDLKKLLTSQIGYEIKRAANECIAYNAARDPRKPKWARVPEYTPTVYAPWSKKQGVTHNKQLAEHGTCMFCIMLASRGFAYQRQETASHAHDNCDCVIVPGWKNVTIQGYDKDALYNEWFNSGFKAKGGGKRSELRAYKDLGVGGRFEHSGLNGMKYYLEASDDLDELYKRAEVVLEDINERWNGDEDMFRSVSRVAKEMRNRLAG